jgi:hypothetical protein
MGGVRKAREVLQALPHPADDEGRKIRPPEILLFCA